MTEVHDHQEFGFNHGEQSQERRTLRKARRRMRK